MPVRYDCKVSFIVLILLLVYHAMHASHSRLQEPLSQRQQLLIGCSQVSNGSCLNFILKYLIKLLLQSFMQRILNWFMVRNLSGFFRHFIESIP